MKSRLKSSAESTSKSAANLPANPAAKRTLIRVIARLNVGGPAVQAVLMTERFRARGWRALLVTGEVPAGEGSMEALADERGVGLIKLRELSRRVSPLADAQSLWRLFRLFRRERPLVVHTHTAKAGTLGRLAALLAGVPVRVHTFHGHVFTGYFSPLATRVFLAIERLLGRRTDCIIALSASQKRELVETYRVAPAEKVAVVPLGFDLEPFLAIPVSAAPVVTNVPPAPCLPALRSPPVVGWIGRMTAIKDPLLFLEVAARIHGLHPRTRFVMVGDGELRAQCEARVRRRGLSDVVELAGWKRNPSSVYCDLDLLLLTSINEGTPLALLEAMASGRPFVAVDVGGVRDLMTASGEPRREQGWLRFDNGILGPRDPVVMAEAAAFLLARPELCREMGAAGREFARASYSDERLADDLERMYLRLARRKNGLAAEMEDEPAAANQTAERAERAFCSPRPTMNPPSSG